MELARETYLVAWAAAAFAGGLAERGGLLEISRAIQALPRPGAPRPLDLLLDGLALLTTGGHAAATTTLQRAAKVLTSIPIEDVLRPSRGASVVMVTRHSMASASRLT